MSKKATKSKAAGGDANPSLGKKNKHLTPYDRFFEELVEAQEACNAVPPPCDSLRVTPRPDIPSKSVSSFLRPPAPTSPFAATHR